MVFAGAGVVTFVLSSFHWAEAAEDADPVRGRAKADFMDFLLAPWIFERRSLQRKETTAKFFRFLKRESPHGSGGIQHKHHFLRRDVGLESPRRRLQTRPASIHVGADAHAVDVAHRVLQRGATAEQERLGAEPVADRGEAGALHPRPTPGPNPCWHLYRRR